MPTSIKYSYGATLGRKSPQLIYLGCVDMECNVFLKKIIKDYSIVYYEEINIPSISNNNWQVNGLNISHVNDDNCWMDIYSLEDMLELEPFKFTRRDSFSKKDMDKLYNELKKMVKNNSKHEEPLILTDAKKYSVMFDALGHPISEQEIIRLSTPTDYNPDNYLCSQNEINKIINLERK